MWCDIKLKSKELVLASFTSLVSHLCICKISKLCFQLELKDSNAFLIPGITCDFNKNISSPFNLFHNYN